MIISVFILALLTWDQVVESLNLTLSKNVTLTTDNNAEDGANVSILHDVTIINNEWYIDASDRDGYHISIDLNSAKWGFHSTQISEIRLEIDSSSGTNQIDLEGIITFSINSTQWLTARLWLDSQPSFNQIAPRCFGLFGTGNIKQIVDNYSPTFREIKVSNGGNFEPMIPKNDHPEVEFPLQFTLRNNPINNTAKLMFTSGHPSWDDFIQICQYSSSFATNTTIQIYVAVTDRDEKWSITRFHLQYLYQSDPSVSPTSVPTTMMPTTSLPTTSLPTSSMPTSTMPTTTMPSTSIPTTSMPTTSIPTTSIPTTSIPTTSIPTISLPTTSTITSHSTAAVTMSSTTEESIVTTNLYDDGEIDTTTTTKTETNATQNEESVIDKYLMLFIISIGLLIIICILTLLYMRRKKQAVINLENLELVDTTNASKTDFHSNERMQDKNDETKQVITYNMNSDNDEEIIDNNYNTTGNIVDNYQKNEFENIVSNTSGNIMNNNDINDNAMIGDGRTVEGIENEDSLLTDDSTDGVMTKDINAGNDVDGSDRLTIKLWLENIKLEEYYECFINNGYQSIEFIKHITNKDELVDIGIILNQHQTIIMNEIGKL